MVVPVVSQGTELGVADDLCVSFVANVRYSPFEARRPVTVSVAALDLVPIGSIKWMVEDPDDPTITDIHVMPEFRRRGIVTLLLRVAEEVADRAGWPHPQHSPHRTAEHEAWAQSSDADPAEVIEPYSFGRLGRCDGRQIQALTEEVTRILVRAADPGPARR